MTLSVTNINGIVATDDPVLLRDCSFPIGDELCYEQVDDVVMNMRTFIGRWENGMSVPALLSQSFEIISPADPNDVCDAPTVSGNHTTCDRVAPSMKVLKLCSQTLQLEELIPAFCDTRGIHPYQLGLVVNSDGSFVTAEPYTADFARYVYRMVSYTFMRMITDAMMTGDFANLYEIDGLYNQLSNGWADGDVACPATQNVASVVDWGALTGNPGTPTPVTEVTIDTNITLWGTSYGVPAGMTWAQFTADLLIPAINANFGRNAGGIGGWELHVPPGMATCLKNNSACLQPCGVSGDFDPDLRKRFEDARNADVVKFFPTQQQAGVMETNYLGDNEFWLIPSTVNGQPTYGMYFENMNAYFSMLGALGDTYGMGAGIPNVSEPLIKEQHQVIKDNFESVAIHHDVQKLAMNCAKFCMMARIGMLVTARHLSTQFTNVLCPNFIRSCPSDIAIDPV